MTRSDSADQVCGRCRRPVCGDYAKVKKRDPRVRIRVRNWPEGPVCVKCYDDAMHINGVCPGCGVDRLLPGITADGVAICTDCAGGLGDFTCPRCGREGLRQTKTACVRCVLAEQLAALLDDGSGKLRPELRPFYDLMIDMVRPRSGLVWLRKPHVPPILRSLAHGDVPLTHDGLSSLSPWRSVIYVRDLLISCHVLPPVDRFLFRFELWLPGWLESIEDTSRRRLLTRYAAWDVLRKLRLASANEPINSYRANNARQHLRVAALFLADLAAQGRGPADCGQGDLDRWFAVSSQSQRDLLRPFIRWSIRHREVPQLRIPRIVHTAGSRLTQAQRVGYIRRVLTDNHMPTADRVLALLILLYAQPLIKISQLTLDDVIRDGQEVALRLGDPPTPVPKPFAVLLINYIDTRSNRTTATNPDSTHLFPGRRAGQPLHTTSLRLRLRNLGLPNITARTTAIRQLVLEAPAPVVAGMLGYHPATTEAFAAEAGATWMRYAPGEHARQPTKPAAPLAH